MEDRGAHPGGAAEALHRGLDQNNLPLAGRHNNFVALLPECDMWISSLRMDHFEPIKSRILDIFLVSSLFFIILDYHKVIAFRCLATLVSHDIWGVFLAEILYCDEF
jgi:hypothetical protein